MAVLAAGPAAATDKSDVMSVIQQWVDAFNKGDAKSATAACADQTSIIDDFPPYEWHGPGACAKWYSEFQSVTKAEEATNHAVTLGKPRHIDVTSDHAYVVVPAGLSYNKKGTPVKETSTVTMSLQKGASGWRITGWSWADG
jgi:ketosteroid isomerase-like protein